MLPSKKSEKSVLFNSIFTCLYLPSFLFLLKHCGVIYDVGKNSFLPLLQVLPAAECVKLSLTYFCFDACEQRGTKGRKNYIKYKITDCFRSVFVLCLTVLAYYVLAVLFGVPLLSQQEETFMFSLLLTCLTVLPVYLHLGWDSGTYMLMNLNSSYDDVLQQMIQQNVLLTLLGAWLGAVVIPLDWDRPWQVWPIPCCLGALAGYGFSHVVTISKYLLKSLSILNIAHKKTGKYGL